MEKAFSCDIILSMNDEKSQATRHDLYEKLWAARDFEISHQWQRSVFLATFLVLLFTMYFTVLGNYVDLVKDSEQVSTNIYTTTVIAQMNHSQDSGHSPFLSATRDVQRASTMPVQDGISRPQARYF